MRLVNIMGRLMVNAPILQPPATLSESDFACRIDPLDFAKESVGLLDLIDRLTLNQPILQPPAQGSAGYGGRLPGAAPGAPPFPFSTPAVSRHCCCTLL